MTASHATPPQTLDRPLEVHGGSSVATLLAAVEWALGIVLDPEVRDVRGDLDTPPDDREVLRHLEELTVFDLVVAQIGRAHV